jgi:phosphoglycolate phosphatase
VAVGVAVAVAVGVAVAVAVIVAVAVAVGVAVAVALTRATGTAFVCVPISPCQAITPQARANVASVAAATRRRSRAIRRARATSLGCGGEDMRRCSAAAPRAAWAEPVNLLRTSVIFDLDGVLIDSRAAITGCLNHALAEHGLPEREPEQLYRFIGPPQSSAFAELLAESFDSPRVRACIASYRACYAETALANTAVFAGIPEALEALAREHRLAVATSKARPFAEQMLRGLGLRERFAFVAGPELDAHDTKTVTLGHALAALGDTRAVMVGDRSFDMVAASAHGLPGIGVAWGIGSREELGEAGARTIVAAPDGLPEAVADVLGP